MDTLLKLYNENNNNSQIQCEGKHMHSLRYGNKITRTEFSCISLAAPLQTGYWR